MTTAHAKKNVAPPDAVDFLGLDALLSNEERLVRDTVRAFVRERVLPNVAEWFEEGVLPQQLGTELGKLGVLGMHLEGYDCPGASAVAYGLACMELEAGDSGVRSFASVQGSLAMFAIHHWGTEEQKHEWLPQMARGQKIGCFGLTEPDFGSNPAGMRTFARRDGASLMGEKATYSKMRQVHSITTLRSGVEPGMFRGAHLCSSSSPRRRVMKLHLRTLAVIILCFGLTSFCRAQDAPAAPAPDQPKPADQTAAPAAAPTAPSPLPSPAITGPLAGIAPAMFDAGPFGKISVNGILTGFGMWQDNHVPGDNATQATLSNGQVWIQKTDGWWQFYVQAGAYTIPALATSVPQHRQNDNRLLWPGARRLSETGSRGRTPPF